ncbi:TioE family transcriptional regulator [Kitasatospora sp. NPDC018619]|uniref:TioE family transcriptional regulator n=1 Tax=unclassified Kitasatospora TaxID=2633591 RepID=UPI003789B10B
MRPADLAREHGISTQAIRNYERDGHLPPADRTPTGYRVYTELHAAALRAFLALVAAFGHATAGSVMAGIHTGRLDDALTELDRGHRQLLRDRETLATVRKAVGRLAGGAPPGTGLPLLPGPRSVGEVAHRLGVTPATLRAWEAAGILTPARDRATGHRRYLPADVRDADLAHLLRRGGYPLAHVATVLRRIRTAGGAGEPAAALDGWQQRLTARGLAMLTASARLHAYLALRPETPETPETLRGASGRPDGLDLKGT